jgi:predicted aconitase
MEQWEKMGLPEELIRNQKRADLLYLKMGAVPLGSCLPYQLGNLPLPA